MPDMLAKSFAVVVHHYRSPRDYTVCVERTGEMLQKHLGLFSDGFAGESHLVVGLYLAESEAWAMAQRLKRLRLTMEALVALAAPAGTRPRTGGLPYKSLT